jgi:glyoxylase-like metal-dependent hydrolase (beta-lactamase superfamily II)
MVDRNAAAPMNMPHLKFQLLKVGHCTHPECIAMRGGRWRSALFPALCGLIEHPSRGWILFDTGYSSHFMDATAGFPERVYRWVTPFTLPPEENLLAQLAALGIGANDIACVLISHMHGDHIAGLRDFPKARFITLRAEFDVLRQKSRLGGLMHGLLPALLPADFSGRVVFADDKPELKLPFELLPFESGFDLFGDGSMFGVPLPGHSRGQMGVVFRQADDRLVFMVADACWSKPALVNNQGPTWLASRVFDHRGDYARTFSRLRQMAAQAQSPTLVPSHCELTWKDLGNESA